MRYDLDLVYEMCLEIGLSAHLTTDQRVEIDLGKGAILCVLNAEREEDCLIGFLGTPWHVHDNPMFADAHGYIEVDYLNLIVGLKEGEILICEQEVEGRMVDRWLIHSRYNDEFEYLDEGERNIIRRAMTRPMNASPD